VYILFIFVRSFNKLLVADDSSMEPAALLGCIHPPLPLLYATTRRLLAMFVANMHR
jgi:hypothetical protein